jgi:DNA-binding MarR family transcriptional regulator
MFDRCLYFNVNALTRLINKKWATAFAEFDLSPAHAYLLRMVLAKPGITQKELANELKLEKSTITRFIDSLQKKQLLLRKTNPIDNREQNIHPSKKAKKLQTALESMGDNLYQELLSTIGKEQLTSLVSLLQDSARNMK